MVPMIFATLIPLPEMTELNDVPSEFAGLLPLLRSSLRKLSTQPPQAPAAEPAAKSRPVEAMQLPRPRPRA